MATTTTPPTPGAGIDTSAVQTNVDPEDTTAWMAQREAELRGDTAAESAPATKLPSEDAAADAPAAGAPPSESAGGPEPLEDDQEINTDDPDADEADKADPKKRRRGGREQRIRQLTRENRELAGRLEKLEAAGEKPPVVAGASTPSEVAAEATKAGFTKTPEDFDSYEAYIDALTDFKLDLRDKTRAEGEERVHRAAQEKQVFDTWTARLDVARGLHEDFDEVVDNDTPLSDGMVAAIIDSEHGAEIAYHLGKNPAEAERIAKLSPNAAVRAIGRLETTFDTSSGDSQPGSPAPKKPVSKAPPPVRPVGGGSAGGVESIYDNNLAQDTSRWLAKREAELSRRAA